MKIGCTFILLGFLLIFPQTAFATLNCDSWLGEAILNECAKHPSNERRTEQNIGVKTDLLKYKDSDVTFTYDRDTANGENKFTIRYETKYEEGLLQTAWGKVKSFFSKE